MKRPEKNEYADFYETYVSLVPESDVIACLEHQIDEIVAAFNGVTDEKGLYAYGADKWTIKEVIGHLIDGERVFAYRALRFSRADATPLPGFDQDPYIENGNANAVSISDLIEELVLNRKANVLMFKNLTAEAWDRTGNASDADINVRALAFILVGHIRHHLKILHERYLA
jgi:hypothetical protein